MALPSRMRTVGMPAGHNGASALMVPSESQVEQGPVGWGSAFDGAGVKARPDVPHR